MELQDRLLNSPEHIMFLPPLPVKKRNSTELEYNCRIIYIQCVN